MDDIDIKDCLRLGLTPVAIEKAYRLDNVRYLAKRVGVKIYLIMELAERWGIETGKSGGMAS